MLLILAVICLAGAAFALAQLVTLPAREREASLRRASSWARGKAKVQARLPLQQLALEQAKERVARLVLRLNPKTSVEEVSFRLLAAGLGRRISPTGFLAGKAFLALGGVAFGLLVGSGSSAALGIVLALMFAAVGFIAPD